MNLGDSFFSNGSNVSSEPVSSITEHTTREGSVFANISTEVVTPPEYRVCFARLSYTILQRKSTHLCA